MTTIDDEARDILRRLQDLPFEGKMKRLAPNCTDDPHPARVRERAHELLVSETHATWATPGGAR